MSAVYRKELKSYFTNMTGYIAMALMLVMAGVLLKIVSLDGRYPFMEYILPSLSLVLLVSVPIVTMKSFAEERHQKTDLLLYTLPIRTTDIVLGKYFAMLTVFAVPTAILMTYPVFLSLYGPVNLVASLLSILAFYLLIAAMTAICMFMSSLTESQVIAAVLGVGALVLCYTSTLLAQTLPTTALASYIAFSALIAAIALIVYYFVKNYWVAFSVAALLEGGILIAYMINDSLFTGLFQKFVSAISIFDAMNYFINNQLFDVKAIVYYLSISFLFCFFTVQTVEKRRFS